MELAVQKREQFGKKVKALRESGLIPAELYGHSVENLHLAVPKKDFAKVLKSAGESTMIQLVIGGAKRPVMIHEVMVDPVTDEVTAVDFYQVRLDEKIKVKVPIVFTGEAPAVKEKQGVLVKALTELEVEALPADLPREITVDLMGLKDIGQNIQIKDLKISANAKVQLNSEFVVATVIAKMTEEEEAKLSAEADLAAVKSETEEKKAERLEKQTSEQKATDEKAAAAPAAGAPAAKPPASGAPAAGGKVAGPGKK